MPEAPEWEGEGGRLSTGYSEIDDLLGGGVPRGRLSEVVGRGSVGTTSLAQRLLASVTTDENFAAWIDVADAFDPASASAAGVALHRLLWVRPPDLVAAFAATEILLATGGFALVFLDTGPVRGALGPKTRQGRPRPRGQAAGGQKGRRMLAAPQTWLRLARAAEQSRTALVVLPGAGSAKEGCLGLAGSAAGVRLELSPVQAVWEGTPGAPLLLEGLVSRIDVTRNRGPQARRQRSRQMRIRLD